MTLMIFLFWLSIFGVIYTILMYPVLLVIWGMFMQKNVQRDDAVRTVSIVIPVYNGENEIERKLKNCLEFDYPKDAVKIIVVSDGSNDHTVNIVRQYESKGIICIELSERYGKVAAQNIAIANVNSEIVIFTDVSIILQSDALKKIISNFSDKFVGAVSCRDQIQNSDQNIGDSFYINYDMLVRKFTTKVGTLIGVTGGFYAVRREITQGGWDPAFPPDFFVALKSIRMGFRVIEDDRVVAKYFTPSTVQGEMTRKIRTITRGMWALFSNFSLLNPLKYGMVSLQLFSHKLLRWFMPFFFMTIVLSNFIIYLSGGSLLYKCTFWLQIALWLYLLISFCIVSRNGHANRLIRYAAMIFMFNISLVLSWKNIIIGYKIVKWESTKRI